MRRLNRASDFFAILDSADVWLVAVIGFPAHVIAVESRVYIAARSASTQGREVNTSHDDSTSRCLARFPMLTVLAKRPLLCVPITSKSAQEH
jgi:hypothetical protein